MTIKEVDAEITGWRQRQKLIAENLDSFTDLPEFRELCGPGTVFVGQTRAQLDLALDTLNGLREQHLALASVLDQATTHRDAISRLVPSRQTLHEIDTLLNGKSIELSSGRTPPQRRELLRGVDQIVRVSPGELIGIMLESFRLIRDGILSVSTIRDRIDAEIQTQSDGIDRLRSTGCDPSEMTALVQLHAGLAALAATDPVTADARRAEIAGRLDELSINVEFARSQTTDARRLLADATALALRVRTDHDRAVQAASERAAKVEVESSSQPITPADESAIADLETQLVGLGKAIERGEFGPAISSLLKWKQAAEEMLARDTAAVTAAEKSLRARTDLRGLFESLQAKAAGQSRGGDPGLARLSDQIHTLLQMRPTPLAEAQRLVGRYQSQLL